MQIGMEILTLRRPGVPDKWWGTAEPTRRLLAVIVVALSAALAIRVPGTAGRKPADLTLVVDPNTVPRGVLLALPRLGPVLTDRVVAERGRRPFGSLADLDDRVRGIGPVTARALAPHLRFTEGGREVEAASFSPGGLTRDP